MAFEIKKISETSQSVEVGEKLWLKADRETVVPDGDPEAAFLLATPGKRLSLEDAVRYGLVKAGSKGGDKQAAKPEDKEAAPESAKDLVARMGDMSTEELEALAGDERKTVQEALEAELAKRADGE